MIRRWTQSAVHIVTRAPSDIQPRPAATVVETGVHHVSGAYPRAIRAREEQGRDDQKIRPRIR